MATGLNEATVKSLPIPERGNKVHYFPGATLQGQTAPRGFGVRITAAGVRSFILNYRLRGRECRYTIGQYPDWSALRAVREARELRQRIDRGDNPLDDRAPQAAPEAPTTVGDVIDSFIARHVAKLRTARSVESALRRLVLPAIGDMPIPDLRRRHIAAMLDAIEANQGPVQASRVVAYLTTCFNWYATRDDEFTSPMVRGMARTRGSERARERVLSDDEIRAIWPALAEAGTFGALCKVLLLTATRRSEAAGLRRSEVVGDVWTIQAERYKTKRPHTLPLSKAALAVIEAQPPGDVVFKSTLGTPLRTFAKPKARVDAASGIAGWTLHDLRRTAQTLMIRAGVRPDIGDRVLGHAQPLVQGTYDRHSYLDEKRHALEALAGIVERIIASPDNVVPLRA